MTRPNWITSILVIVAFSILAALSVMANSPPTANDNVKATSDIVATTTTVTVPVTNTVCTTQDFVAQMPAEITEQVNIGYAERTTYAPDIKNVAQAGRYTPPDIGRSQHPPSTLIN